jgi:RNA polymerase sigma factor (TIGR02999 family)
MVRDWLMDNPEDITTLLVRWRDGKPGALDDVIVATYPRLRKLAESFLRRESPGHTIQATALVHEIYLLLLRQRKVEFEDRSHFYGAAAALMRAILRDWARAKGAMKRGEKPVRVPLSEDLSWVDADSAEFLDLDAALTELEQLDERKARLIELKTFLGCSTAEAAEQLGISKATADRDLRLAKAWLFQRLRGTGAPVE